MQTKKGNCQHVGQSAAAVAAGALAAAISAPAAADIIRVDGLNAAVSGSFSLDVDYSGTYDVSIANLFSLYGSDYWGNAFYTRSVSVGALSGGGVGAPVAPGTLIGPAMTPSAKVTLDSTSASFQTRQVGTRVVHHPATCGKFFTYDCSWDETVAIYGSVGTYTEIDSYLGASILVPFSFLSGTETDFGWLDLSISNSGTRQPYTVVLNGYGYDDSGSPVSAGAAAAVTPPPPPPIRSVPEPGSLLLLATGVLGLAAYRRERH